MKTILLAAMAALMGLSSVQAADPGEVTPQLPRKAMPFGIQTGPGQYTWLNEFEGKTCLVAFILTSCPHCQFTTGVLNRLQAEFAGRNVQIIESAAEAMAALHIPQFKAAFRPAFPVGYNDQAYIAKFLGYSEDAPMMFPTIAILDKNGVIQVQMTGDDKLMSKDIQEKSLREAIERVAGAARPATTRTKSTARASR